MNEGLQQITDWSDRAAAALWCVAGLAEGSHVSIATLERHFHDTLQLCPRAWLTRERLRRAVELLADGSSIKETSRALAYKNQHHFSLAFKKHFGYAPKLHRRQTPDARRQTPNSKKAVEKRWFDEFRYKVDEFRYISGLAESCMAVV